MWSIILNRLPSLFTFTLALLSALLPWVIYKINKMLHHYADPPWKKENEK